MSKKFLLICGILSSLHYTAMNIFIPMFYDGYNVAYHTVSELSAIDAPTRNLWIWLGILYPLLFAAFGWGVLKSANGNRYLRILGIIIITYAVLNIYWPPMHQREVLAAGGKTLTDTLHLVWAAMTVLFMMLMMGFGAAAFGKRFRIYTIISVVFLFLFGFLTSLDAPNVEANLSTPYAGVWERINIGIFLLWIIVLAIILIKKPHKNEVTNISKTIS